MSHFEYGMVFATAFGFAMVSDGLGRIAKALDKMNTSLQDIKWRLKQ